MKHSLAWIEKFIASDKQKAIAMLSPEKQIEALCTLIEIGQIDSATYLTWASQLFLLPSLDSQFFLNVDIEEIWKKYSLLGAWSPEVFPVAEWENQLMIACVSPPSEFAVNLLVPPYFVLASPLDLKPVWEKLHPVPAALAPVTQPKAEIKLEQLDLKLTELPVESSPLPLASEKTASESSIRFNFKIDPEFKTIELGAELQKEEPLEATLKKSDKAEKGNLVEAPGGFVLDLDITNTAKVPNFNFAPPKLAPPKTETLEKTVSQVKPVTPAPAVKQTSVDNQIPKQATLPNLKPPRSPLGAAPSTPIPMSPLSKSVSSPISQTQPATPSKPIPPALTNAPISPKLTPAPNPAPTLSSAPLPAPTSLATPAQVKMDSKPTEVELSEETIKIDLFENTVTAAVNVAVKEEASEIKSSRPKEELKLDLDKAYQSKNVNGNGLAPSKAVPPQVPPVPIKTAIVTPQKSSAKPLSPTLKPNSVPLAQSLKAISNEQTKSGVTATNAKGLSGKKDLRRNYTHSRSAFDECLKLDEVADLMFAKMQPHFEMSMLIRCDDQILKPIYWAGEFKTSDEQKPEIIDIHHASIFKIVHASGKPYHGYVIANTINNRFFAEWNSAEIPKHVSIFPIFVDKYLVGMWLGATNKSLDLKGSFSDLEALTNLSVKAFQKAIKLAA